MEIITGDKGLDVVFTREEALDWLASALHNYTVDAAAQLAQAVGSLELAAVAAAANGIKDRAALRALGVTDEEISNAHIEHAH